MKYVGISFVGCLMAAIMSSGVGLIAVMNVAVGGVLLSALAFYAMLRRET